MTPQDLTKIVISNNLNSPKANQTDFLPDLLHFPFLLFINYVYVESEHLVDLVFVVGSSEVSE